MPGKILEPNLWNLENLFNSIYDVPVYQRPYSWDKEQVEILLNDILCVYNSENKNEGYYIGNLIIYNKNEKINGLISKYDIIDGQQRITTFSLILLALYSISLTIGVSESDDTLINIKKHLWKFVNRTYDKNLRTISLNSIEKKCFSELFNSAFDQPKQILDFCNKYHRCSNFDERVITNFKYIYIKIQQEISDTNQDDILNFADYILQYIQFIVIEANCKANKVFSMFESINSKGKKLEEIDLIKTYIFSKLDIASYDIYLAKWGELIIATNDNLYDYLYTYIKAYLCFYRQNINIINFKSIAKKELLLHFNETNEACALKMLMDDLYNKVKYYNMLVSVEDADNLVKNNKFKFFYKLYVSMAYQHPKPLLMRTLVEFDNGNISKDDVICIVSNIISFMLKFLTISNRDSKDVITMFSNIMNDIYETNLISKSKIENEIANEFIKQGVTQERVKLDLKDKDLYEQNKKVAAALLSLYESYDNEKIYYDKAYMLFNAFGNGMSLDHMLVQNPKKESVYKYYKDETDDVLILKQGHDFPTELATNGMDYDLFISRILNIIGNLRLYYRDKNSSRKNDAIAIMNYNNFVNYKDIKNRTNKIVDCIIDYCLPNPQIDPVKVQISSYKKTEKNLPKMNKLIEFGLVKVGDKLYNTVNPENSVATLLDDKYVEYNSKRMTLNEWGCLVTNWKSIRIYAYTAVVGEVETLHKKRIEYLESHND